MADDWLNRSLQGAGAGATAGAAIGAPTGIGAPIGAAVGGAIGFLAPIVADLIGRALASGDTEKARQYAQMAVDQYGPDILKTPELQSLIPHLGPSAMQNVAADPMAVAAQHEALAGLQRASRPDDLEFRAATNAAEMHANQQAGAQQGAIRQQLQARGLGGSGVDFALRQQAGSDAANRSAGMGFNAAVEGRRQALQALQQYGALGGQVRGQSFDEGAQKARAADEVARFNEAGRVAGTQQNFQNQMGLAGARAGAYSNAANVYNGQAAQTQQQFANYGQAAGQAGGALGQWLGGQRQQDDDWNGSGSYSRGR